ncbi:Maf family protein [bacterium]|nr:Maf family protein [bacterium]
MTTTPIILASASPRRHQLLDMYGIAHSVHTACIIEPLPEPGEPPGIFSTRAAKNKACSLIENYSDRIILGVDTVVVFKDTILGKPSSQTEARKMISLLSGQEHIVVSGMCLILPSRKIITGISETQVRFRVLSEIEIDWYVSTEDGLDKAGAYGIQSLGGSLVRKIIGDWHNVVGLPIPLLLSWLIEYCPGYWPPSRANI